MTDQAPDILKPEAPLESWKEIATYLQRDVTTVIRWEKSEGLPVHRHHHLSRSSVYAYPSELEAWRSGRGPKPEIPPPWRRPVAAVALSLVVLLTMVSAGGDRGLGKAEAADGIVTRQVWSGPDVGLEVAVSPDGRYLAFQDVANGDLAIRDLTSGETRRLTNKKGGWENWHEYATDPVFSPDGTQVAFGWEAHDSCELRVVGIDGSGLRVLDPGTKYGVFPMDWSRDGKFILVLLLNNRQVATVSVADGSMRILKSIDWLWSVPGTVNPDVMRFSPDGRFVLFDRPVDEAGNRDVYVFSVATGEVTPLVQHPANDAMLGWAPDGRSVVFLSDRTGSWAAWQTGVANGKPLGEPKVVNRTIGMIRPIGFTRDGSFYYRVLDAVRNVYVATLGAGRPSPLTPHGGSGPAWSPDGKRIAYLSPDRPPRRTLVIRSMETGSEREYAPELPIMRRPQWSPDGKSILLNGVESPQRGGWYLFDLETQQLTPALLNHGTWVSTPLSADGKGIYYIEPADEQTKRAARVMRRDLGTGRDEQIRVLPDGVRWGNHVFASPDGRWLALVQLDARGDDWDFALLPLGGGEIRVLPGPWTDVQPWRLTWAPDSRQLMFIRPGGEGGKTTRSELWAISVEGGKQRNLGLSVPQDVFNLSVHPDGKHVALTLTEEAAEVWVMEDLLPDTGGSKR
jgi:Tol biopolymer transport system component